MEDCQTTPSKSPANIFDDSSKIGGALEPPNWIPHLGTMSHRPTWPGSPTDKDPTTSNKVAEATDSSGYSEQEHYMILANRPTLTNMEYDLFKDLGLQTAPPTTTTNESKPPKDEERKKDRAIRNRESAQASRERKRKYMSELEESRETLAQESRTLRARVGLLEDEKTTLVGELVSLRNDLNQLRQLLLGKGVTDDTNLLIPTLTTPATEGTTIASNDDNCKRYHHCAIKDGMEAHMESSMIRTSFNPNMSKAAADLSAQPWVWRSTLRNALKTPVYDPSHSPSANSHLLVQDGVGPLPDQQGLRHVLRLRLRYRRPSMMRPSLMDTVHKRNPISGYAHGKNTLLVAVRGQRNRGTRNGSYRRMPQEELSFIWKQIMRRKKLNKRYRK